MKAIDPNTSEELKIEIRTWAVAFSSLDLILFAKLRRDKLDSLIKRAPPDYLSRGDWVTALLYLTPSGQKNAYRVFREEIKSARLVTEPVFISGDMIQSADGTVFSPNDSGGGADS